MLIRREPLNFLRLPLFWHTTIGTYGLQPISALLGSAVHLAFLCLYYSGLCPFWACDSVLLAVFQVLVNDHCVLFDFARTFGARQVQANPFVSDRLTPTMLNIVIWIGLCLSLVISHNRSGQKAKTAPLVVSPSMV